MRDNLKKNIDESIFLKKKLYENKYKKIINEIIETLYSKIIDNKKIFICGNGGSAADAQHLSTEFLVRLNPKKNRKPYPLFTLTSDPTNMSAIGNDFGFENIFKKKFRGKC